MKIHVSCLLCGSVFDRRGFGRHATGWSHKNQGDLWWKYDRNLRRILAYYRAQALDHLSRQFVFAKAESPDALPRRTGKTVHFFRYAGL